jgi:glucan phosphorylase
MATTDLSLEFLMGRALDNAMLNVGQKDAARGKCFSLDKTYQA